MRLTTAEIIFNEQIISGKYHPSRSSRRGKTFLAKRLAFLHMGAIDESKLTMLKFHQSYFYEEFNRG